MKTVIWNNQSQQQRLAVLQRAPQTLSSTVRRSVTEILSTVREKGDQAVQEYARQFDRSSSRDLKVSTGQIDSAVAKVAPSVATAIETAYERIKSFHELGKPAGYSVENDSLTCGVKYVPIDRVGLYVPGGKTPLPSTALMLGVPAQIAGCSRATLCTTPGVDGEMDPATMFAAQLCGIETVFCIGGAQAIAAMAYGTEAVTRSDKIFGPGGVWVTEAKRQVQSSDAFVSIDMPAGPSEVLVVADETADPEFVACDMLAQLEHGPDSQAILVTLSESLAGQVELAISKMVPGLSRNSIICQSIEFARIIVADSMDQAMDISNEYAPEHLILQTENADSLLDMVTSAGSVFVGSWTPEVIGDYCSGTNHVLPTGGFARSLSGLSVADFMKRITVQRATRPGLVEIAPTAVELARYESLDAHERAVTVRQTSLNHDREAAK